jgi:hypothetical protein
VAGVDEESLLWGVMLGFVVWSAYQASRTAISSHPSWAAKCNDVLLLSRKSGFRKASGFEVMMRLTRSGSLR